VSQHRDEHLDLCAGWALGCLDDADRARLEAHLADGCDVCETALREFGEATTWLAAAAPVTRPPARLRARVLDAARAAGRGPATERGTTRVPETIGVPTRTDRIVPIETARRGRSAFFGWLAAAVCAGLLIWSATSLLRLRARTADQTAQIAELERERAALEERLAEADRWVGVVTAADARLAVLRPTAQGDAAFAGRAIVDPGSRRAVVTLTHATPPEGRDYELWSIRDGKPRSLGLIRADAAGHAFLQLEIGDVATLQALAVSLEPKGGAPTKEAPSGPVVLLGALGG
jgi:anti-sigma-K factor RskA